MGGADPFKVAGIQSEKGLLEFEDLGFEDEAEIAFGIFGEIHFQFFPGGWNPHRNYFFAHVFQNINIIERQIFFPLHKLPLLPLLLYPLTPHPLPTNTLESAPLCGHRFYHIFVKDRKMNIILSKSYNFMIVNES